MLRFALVKLPPLMLSSMQVVPFGIGAISKMSLTIPLPLFVIVIVYVIKSFLRTASNVRVTTARLPSRPSCQAGGSR